MSPRRRRRGRRRRRYEIIEWLIGYGREALEAELAAGTDFETFFDAAPRMNAARGAITGVVCGVRVEAVEESVMRQIRYLDKLVDELARGKRMEKIFAVGVIRRRPWTRTNKPSRQCGTRDMFPSYFDEAVRANFCGLDCPLPMTIKRGFATAARRDRLGCKVKPAGKRQKLGSTISCSELLNDTANFT
ncbi:MAG TPA: DUF2200 family protein [Allosphingosinicella sp.]|jgi:hypothetical protein